MNKLTLLKKQLFWLLLLPVTLNAQTKYPSALDKYMQSQVKINDFSGTVLIEKKGKLIYSASFGEADKEWHIKNNINSKYLVGSLTKQFTAACILSLEEQGKLELEDKLSKYIPDYPKGDQITIKMLLNQTTGIKDYTEIPDSGSHSDVVSYSPLQVINEFKRAPFNFTPGTRWEYSNSNYFLLGYIVEKISGERYSDYLQKNILQKAQLTNTGMNKTDSVLQYRAKGYEFTGYSYVNAPYFVVEGPYSAGGMYSTVSDLYHWENALMGNKVLSGISVKKMTTPYMGHYGYAQFIDSLETHKRIWHNGGIPGFSSCLTYYPENDIIIVVLSNNESNATAISSALAGVLFNLPVINAYAHHEQPSGGQAIPRSYAGTYIAGNQLELIIKGNKLYRKGKGSGDMELKAESANKFFYSDGSDRQIEFNNAKNGTIKAYIIAWGLKTEMKKLN